MIVRRSLSNKAIGDMYIKRRTHVQPVSSNKSSLYSYPREMI